MAATRSEYAVVVMVAGKKAVAAIAYDASSADKTG
jgi:hypothetical protein